jgi:hypothetical protein
MPSHTSPLILLCALAACTGSAARRESAALSDAVDRYRRAESASKPGQREAVAAVSCTDAEVCATKQVCLAAIDPTTRALTLKDEVAARLVDIQSKRLAPDAPEADALPGKLDEAERLLHEGRAKMTDCDAKLMQLRVRYGM